METTIKNEYVTAVISQQAAEVISFKDNKTDIETVWCRDPQYWYNCNPILFPFVGPLIDNKFIYDGKEYSMTQHGFVRRARFELVQIKKDEVTLSLKSSTETLEKYPFEFDLTVRYFLDGYKLNMEYSITNFSDKEMPFNVGFHPAFNCPSYDDEKYKECYIEFPQDERLSANVNQINLKDGNKFYLIDAINEEYEEVFFRDGIIKSDTVTLHTPDFSINVCKKDYDVLGFWRKRPSAPFVCVEPQFPSNTLKKDRTFRPDSDNNLLNPNETFKFSYYWQLSVAK